MKRNTNPISEKIRYDWGTLKRFAEKNGLNYQGVRNALSGNPDNSLIVTSFIEHGYIRSIEDLKKDDHHA